MQLFAPTTKTTTTTTLTLNFGGAQHLELMSAQDLHCVGGELQLLLIVGGWHLLLVLNGHWCVCVFEAGKRSRARVCCNID